METLDKANKTKTYKIVGYVGETDAVLRRLLELGFTVGQKAKVVSKSLAKKVFLIEIRGYLVSIRADLLSRIEVES